MESNEDNRAADPGLPPEHGEWLRREVGEWTREALIQKDQAGWILARYGLMETETPRSLKRVPMIRIIAALGAVLVGIGVLLVMGANWEEIPRFGRLVLLMFATGGCYFTGYALAHGRGKQPAVGTALLLLGSMIWGVSILLIFQMYYVAGEDGENAALPITFCGVLPLAYLLRSPLHLALSVVLGAGWLLFVVSSAPNWSGTQVSMLLLAVGCLLYLLGMLHRGRTSESAFASIYAGFGLAFVMCVLYALTFVGIHDRGETRHSLPAILLAVSAAGALFAAFARVAKTDRASAWEARALAVLSVVGFVLLYAPAKWATGDAFAWKLTMNLLLFGTELGMIGLGWKRLQPGLVNVGLAVFFVHLMTRYFDLLSGMLPQGLGLIGAGLLMLFSGIWLERQRKNLLRSMKGV